MGKVVAALKAIGRLVGAVGLLPDGTAVKARKARLVVTGTALLVAVFSYFGLPDAIGKPLADFLVALGGG